MVMRKSLLQICLISFIFLTFIAPVTASDPVFQGEIPDLIINRGFSSDIIARITHSHIKSL